MRSYPTPSKDDNTTCSDMILLGVHLSGPGGSRASISTSMICLVVVLSPFSRECLAVAIRRVHVEEMTFYSDMKFHWSKFSMKMRLKFLRCYRHPANLAMVPVPNHLMMSKLAQHAMDKDESCNRPESDPLSNKWFQIAPIVVGRGKSFESRVQNAEESVPFKKCRRYESKSHGVLKMVFDFDNEARESLCKMANQEICTSNWKLVLTHGLNGMVLI